MAVSEPGMPPIANAAENQAALNRGEKRTLLMTEDGRLWSYARDESGFRRDGFIQVRSWWGVGIIGLVMLAGFVFSIVLFIVPGFHDPGRSWKPFWGAIWPLLISLLLLWVSVRNMTTELRPRRIRRERGVPEPA